MKEIKKKKGMKKWRRSLIIFAILIGILAVVPAISVDEVFASEKETSRIGAVFLYDEELDCIGYLAAFAVSDGNNILVMSGYEDVSGATQASFVSETREYQLTSYEDNKDAGLILWTVSDEDVGALEKDSVPMNMGQPFKNQSLNITYLIDDDTLVPYMMQTTAKELSGGILTLDSYPSSESGEICYPAVVTDENQNLVGILANEEDAYSTWADENAFYENLGDSSGQPDREPSDTPVESPSPRQPAKPKKVLSNFFRDIMAGALIGAIAGLGGFLLRRFLKKENKVKTNNTNNSKAADVSLPPTNEVGETVSIDDIGETVAVNEEFASGISQRSESKPAWLVAKGGYMDGRVYPINEMEITIGRGNTNTIGYPMKMDGISRNHVKLYWQGNKLMLMDCNSLCGTFLKSAGKVPPYQPIEVKIGEIIYIGDMKNAFQINGK